MYYIQESSVSISLNVGDTLAVSAYQSDSANRFIASNGSFSRLSISRFPTSSELVVTPERQNTFAGIKGTTAGTNTTAVTASSWTTLTFGANTFTRTEFGKAKVESNNVVSVTIDNLPVGSYYVTATGSFYAAGTTNGTSTSCFFGISDTNNGTPFATMQTRAYGDASTADQNAFGNTVGGIYKNTSVSSKTFYVEGYRESTTGTCYGFADSNRPITISVIPLDQPSNSALYVEGPVKAAATGAAIPEGYVNEFSTRSITDTSLRTQATPASGTWYYPWTGELTLPAGNWLMCYNVLAQTDQASSSTAQAGITTRIENKTDNTDVLLNTTLPSAASSLIGFGANQSGCQPVAITTSKTFRIGLRWYVWGGSPTVNNMYLRCDISNCKLQAIRLN
jgi:hypothetical protein